MDRWNNTCDVHSSYLLLLVALFLARIGYLCFIHLVCVKIPIVRSSFANTASIKLVFAYNMSLQLTTTRAFTAGSHDSVAPAPWTSTSAKKMNQLYSTKPINYIKIKIIKHTQPKINRCYSIKTNPLCTYLYYTLRPPSKASKRCLLVE